MEGNLAELKREMGEIIETSSAAYDARLRVYNLASSIKVTLLGIIHY